MSVVDPSRTGSVATPPRARPRPAAKARAILAGPPLPREHGAWFMLLGPLVIGIAAPEGPPLPAAAALLAVLLAVFLGQDVARRLWRRQRGPALVPWLVLWAILAAAAGGALLVARPRAALAVIAAAGAVLFAIELALERARDKRLQPYSDFLAAAGLSLAAPAALVVGGARGWSLPVLVWLACLGYFASSVVHVRLLLACARLRRAGDAAVARAARPSLAYHALLGAAVLSLPVVVGPAAGLAWIAGFAPVVGRGLRGALGAHGHAPSLKRAGVLESAYAVSFAGFAVLALWLGR